MPSSIKDNLPQLVKKPSTYKLVVPQNVEEKIRYLIRKFPHTEWSGVLFYTYKGTFEDNNLIITCQDIYPMDLGTSGWTEFRMSEDVASYIAENIELFDCEMGLVHSHHTMGAFFSGQDNKMLVQEGNDTNCFVSLVVDTPGNYVAAITRKIQKNIEVTAKHLGSSYKFFGMGDKTIVTSDETPTTKIVSSDIIEYYMLEVERHAVTNSFDYLDTRFEEIERKKKSTTPLSSGISKFNKDSLFSKSEPTQLELFNTESAKQSDNTELLFNTSSKWTPDPHLIKKAVVKMITCSLIINPNKFDIKNWIEKNMNKVYEKIFGPLTEGVGPFTEWKDFIIEYTLDYYEDPSLPEDVDFTEFYRIVAEAIYDELSAYIHVNPYITSYCDSLEAYIND